MKLTFKEKGSPVLHALKKTFEIVLSYKRIILQSVLTDVSYFWMYDMYLVAYFTTA